MPLPAAQVTESMQRSAQPTLPNGSARAGSYTLIFTIRHAKSKALLKRHKLILFPTSFTQETESRSSLYYSKGGIFADVPLESGIGITVFTISGHTGYRGVPADNQNPIAARFSSIVTPESFRNIVETVGQSIGRGLPPQGSLVDGMASIKDLADTIRGYFYPQGQQETADVPRTQDLQLEFFNASAPVSAQDTTGLSGWLVFPHRNLVSLRQDAQRPFIYSYTFTFAGIARLNLPVTDPTVEILANPKQSLRDTLNKLSRVIKDTTNAVNTIRDSFDQLVIQQFTGPVGTLLQNTAQLGDAVNGFMTGLQDKIKWPLYAQRQLSNILEAPVHSVSTLKESARLFASVLVESSLGLARSIPGAGTLLTGGTNDELTMRLNNEDPVKLTLGTLSGGTAIAAAIQSQVRALTPQHTSNLSAYEGFTATYTQGQYVLTSGTSLSDAARVSVVADPDTDLAPRDASSTLGLGLLNGGQERPGTAAAIPALSLLQGLDEACTHLLANPDWFADQLAAQDAQLAQRFPSTVLRPQIRGDQYLSPVAITPGDTLQSLAARVGVPWETLALVNNLTYPYILQEPSILTTGRVSSADCYHLVDDDATWPVNGYQGRRVFIPAGAGAGQTRIILRNTATVLLLDHAWQVLPNDTSDYQILEATNPIIQTSIISAATIRTIRDTALSLIPDSQRGYQILVADGPSAGQRVRIVANSTNIYTIDPAWQVIPTAGSTYLVLTRLQTQRLRQRLLGETISVPRPSTGQRNPAIRGRLEDVSSITGQAINREEKLFGRDLLLEDGGLVWDPVTQDLVTIAGLENLRQAVKNLVQLPLGELEYAPGLGSYMLEELGSTATLPTQLQLLQSVERTITQDARIARLAGAQKFTQGGRTFLSLTAAAKHGDVVERVVIQ